MRPQRLMFYDGQTFERPQLIDHAVGMLKDAVAGGTPKLRVKIDATHSGFLVNNRVYPGAKVKDSAGTWVDKAHGGSAQYNKPVLLHHKDGSGWSDAVDPIGRIVSQEFVQVKNGRGFENDFKRPAQDGLGSGYIMLEAEVSDPDAIQKILDGRYLTVSTGQTTNAAICSVCGEDWLNRG